MNSYTAHLGRSGPPVLLREGWSWGAALFGPAWLLLHRAWLPAAASAAAWLLAVLALPGFAVPPALAGLVVLGGMLGRDALRWSLERRGLPLVHVLAASSEEAALGRLLTARQDLVARYGDEALR